MLRRLRSRLTHLLRAARSRHELEEEMDFHIERLTQDLVREGMGPKEARRQARIRFGSTERVQARAREERGLELLDETARHLRTAVRSMRRAPLFALTFVATLSLCIGTGTTVFSVVDAALWRTLPYPAPERLAHVVFYTPSFGKSVGYVSVDGWSWERVRDEGDPLDRAVYSGTARGVNLSTRSAAAFVREQRVGAGYFRVLGVPPLLGREFTEAEDVPDGPPVAILGHGLWTRTFGAEPEILGSTIRLKGEAHTVVGVMPPEFDSMIEADVWTPLRPSTRGEGGGTNYAILVRVPDAMSLEEADARLGAIDGSGSPQGGPETRRFGLVAYDASLTAGLRLPMLVLLGAVGLMLVVGCANLAGLQIARSLARTQEMATRQALGSGSAALARQLVVENVLLGIVGGAVGLALASLSVDAVEGLVQSRYGIWQDVRLDARAVAAAAGLTALATLLFGLVPVVRAARPGIQRALVGGARVVGRGGHGLRKLLLVGQVGVVTALLFGAGLLVRSYGHLEGLDPGFDPVGVLSIQFSLDDARYDEPATVHGLFRESLEAIRRIPGVSSAAVSLTLPYERPLNIGFRVAGEESGRVVNLVYVTPGFFEMLEVPLLQGRVLDEGDRVGTPMVAVANEAFVAYALQGRAPLGETIHMGAFGDDGGTVVGVVGNVQQSAGWGDTSQPVWETPTLYVPAMQGTRGLFSTHLWFSPSWLVRGSAPADELAAQLTRVFQEVDADLPVARVASLEEVMDRAFAPQRFEAAFLMAVSAMALLLAGIGLYGIVAHEVLERRTEMGLRMALGATPGNAVWSAGVGGVRLTALGLVLGGLATVGVARVLQNLVWGVVPWDPAILVSLVAVLVLLASVASFVPAARVGRMDPATILRDG